MLIGSTMHL